MGKFDIDGFVMKQAPYIAAKVVHEEEVKKCTKSVIKNNNSVEYY